MPQPKFWNVGLKGTAETVCPTPHFTDGEAEIHRAGVS